MSEIIKKTIKELPPQTADKIAAGEVVDRPLSVVKELVENSIDAGSTSIAVEIRNGGKSYIRVTDNGCGIAADETQLAFKRHATSKLRTIKDLDSIDTLGFRGEALASIAAVSKAELITKTAEAETGTSVQIEGGVTASVSETGCPQGTTIIIRDLFFNTPARLKFLKKDSTESGLIIDFVSKMALAYPDIRIRLINNGNTLFATQGKGNMFNAIATIYSPAMAKKLIHLREESSDGLIVEGYISSPDETRANRKNQIFFVNGRYIQSRLLESCVSDGYREKLFEGRHPVIFLFVTISPELIDVNIHPNKKEIRFDDETAVKTFVTQAIKNALKVPEAVPEFTFKRDRLPESEEKMPKANFPKQEQLDIRKILQQKRVNEEEEKYTAQKESEKSVFVPSVKPAERRLFDVAGIRPVGTIFASYILGCDDDSFYMIDQHAAHERVFYEKLTREFYGQQTASQILALPIQVNVSPIVKNAESEWLDFLQNIGFAIEEFGPRSYAVKAIPAYMTDTEAVGFINDFFDSLDEPSSFKDRKRADKIITHACKSAVKANDRLDAAEITQLIKDLALCDNPFSCPHGRPTVIRMKKSEIETLFKR
jgi:DNA mismatch repair protein MutL